MGGLGRHGAMGRPVVCMVACVATVTHALLFPPTVSPESYTNVDAGDFLHFTIRTRALAASGVGADFVHNIRVTDPNAVAPSDYDLAWLRYQPPPNLPKPPDIAQQDLTLVYLAGDVGLPYKLDGVLHTVDSLPVGDEFVLEVGIELRTSVEVGQAVSMPRFQLEWWSAPPCNNGTRYTGEPAVQPSAVLANAHLRAVMTGQSLLPARGSVLAAVGGETLDLTVRMTLPEGTLSHAYLHVAFDGPGQVFANARVLSVSTTRNPITAVDSVTSTCGAYATAVLPLQRTVAVAAADAPANANITAVSRLELPLCTLVNVDRDNGEEDVLTLRLRAQVRGDDWLAKATATSVVVTFSSNFTFDAIPPSPLSSVVVATADMQPLSVQPVEVVGVLPDDRVEFAVQVTHAPASDAPAYRVSLEDWNQLQGSTLPYQVLAVSLNGIAQPVSTIGVTTNQLAFLQRLPVGDTMDVRVLVRFTDDVQAGEHALQAPLFTVVMSSHPFAASSRFLWLQPPATVTATSTPFLTSRITSSDPPAILTLGPEEQPFFVTLETHTYPDCVFIDYSAENNDGFCSTSALRSIGVASNELLDCIPLRITLAPSGCLRTDPDTPPASPSVTLRSTVSPEFFNTYPELHSTTVLLRSLSSNAVVTPSCGDGGEVYDSHTGDYERRLCDYGVYAMVSMVIEPSPSPSPIPIAQRGRTIIQKDEGSADVAVLSVGILLLLIALLGLGSVVYNKTKGEWPWDTMKEQYLLLTGDPDAVRRNLRKKRLKRELKAGRKAQQTAQRNVESKPDRFLEVDVPTPGPGEAAHSRRRPKRKIRMRPPTPPSSPDEPTPRSLPGYAAADNEPPEAWAGKYVNPLSHRPAHDKFYYSTAP